MSCDIFACCAHVGKKHLLLCVSVTIPVRVEHENKEGSVLQAYRSWKIHFLRKISGPVFVFSIRCQICGRGVTLGLAIPDVGSEGKVGSSCFAFSHVAHFHSAAIGARSWARTRFRLSVVSPFVPSAYLPDTRHTELLVTKEQTSDCLDLTPSEPGRSATSKRLEKLRSSAKV